MNVAVYATHESYRQHLRPVADALSTTILDRYRDAEADVWLTASARDHAASRMRPGRHVVTEHGCGLEWYPPNQLRRLGRADAIAAPNEYVASRYRELPNRSRIEVVGTPKMDALLAEEHRSDGRTVAVSFHWTGRARAMETYREALMDLDERTTVLGHAHPRIWERAAAFYEAIGIEAVCDFAEVVRRADVYACDHSSTLYEWAALDRPVVLLDRERSAALAPRATGLRYDMHEQIGATATPQSLRTRALAALDGDEDHAQARADATAALYPNLGTATARMVELLDDVGGKQ